MKDNRDRSMVTFRKHFDAAMDHFGHSEEAQSEAWAVAMQHLEHARTCYRAIYNSLGRDNGLR